MVLWHLLMVRVNTNQNTGRPFLFCFFLKQTRMDRMGKLKESQKAYQAHTACIYGKMKELDSTQPAAEETTSLAM